LIDQNIKNHNKIMADFSDLDLSKLSNTYWERLDEIKRKCLDGDMQMVIDVLTCDPNSFLAPMFQAAACGGHNDMIKYIITHCDSHNISVPWTYGMRGASSGGNIQLFQIFYECHKSTPLNSDAWDHYPDARADALDHCLNCAAEGGRIEMIQFLLTIVPEEYPFTKDDWDYALCGAAKGGHIHAIQYFIGSEGPFQATDLDNAIEWATEAGKLDAIIFLINLSDPTKKHELTETVIHIAAMWGHHDIIMYYLNETSPDTHQAFWELCLHGAAKSDNLRIASLAIDNGADNWKQALAANNWSCNQVLTPFFEKKIAESSC